MSVNNSISVEINGKLLADIRRVVSTFDRERVVQNGALEAPGATMYVTIKRVKPAGDRSNDGVRMRVLKDFLMIVRTPEYVSTYTHCQWLGFTETIEEDETVIEEIKISSLNCSMSFIP